MRFDTAAFDAHMAAMQDQPRAASPCPICAKPAAAEFRPFCSKRCADVDLHRWLAGVYAVPGKEDEDEGGGAQHAPDDGRG
jgi:endogenous inhibitor of DNA gyrase (YacG/DUF329 family)